MPTTTETRVSDEALRDRLVQAFKGRRGEATTADLVATTGLPLDRVEAELPSISDEFGARLRVTESGELLYSFPKGLRSRYRGFGPSLSRFWKAFKKGAVEAAILLFKAWIVVLLVGYFVLFIALAIVALVASVAMRSSGRDGDNDRGGGIGGVFLTGRLLDTIFNIWFYSEVFKDPRQRAWEADARDRKRRERRPLHKAIFSFVFGEPDPNTNWDEVERKAVLAWLQAHKGIITMPEFRAVTGLAPLQAEDRITRYLKDFRGKPEVSEAGTLYYAFPDLLRRADSAPAGSGLVIPLQRLRPFSANKGKANFWFGAINLVNLLFGAYFLYNASVPHSFRTVMVRGREVIAAGGDFLYIVTAQLAKAAGIADPAGLIAVALGFVPLTFAGLFYAIPALRRLRLARQNERIRFENLRRFAYKEVLDHPEGMKSTAIKPDHEEAKPGDPRAAERILVELAAAEGGEPGVDDSWTWPATARARKDAELLRAAIKSGDFALGKTVFDSHE